MSFDFTKPNSTPRRSAPLVLNGVEAAGLLGTVTPSPNIFAAPEIAALLTGVEALGEAGTLLELPNIVVLTGVQATCHLSDDEGQVSDGTVVFLTGNKATGGTGLFGGVAPAGIPLVKPVSVLDIPAILKTMQVPGGPCAGAFYLNTAKGEIDWYAANVGLVSICQFLNAADLDTYIRPYLDAYVTRLNGDGSIQDVTFNAGPSDLAAIGTQPQADEDAVAASFIRLAYRYTIASQNFAWFDTNKGALTTILDNNIANNLRADGLVANLAGTRRLQADVSYLRNNCEDWAALNEYSSLLTQRNDTFNAARYANTAGDIAQALAAMWVDSGPFAPGFRATSSELALAPTFNPNVVAQAYPQAMGVAALQGRYADAYTFINTRAAGWESLGYDPEPWMVLGLVAALRGDATKANTQTAAFEASYAAAPNAVTINELGMYQRIKSVLAGLPQA